MLLINFKILGVEIKMLSQGKSANQFMNNSGFLGLRRRLVTCVWISLEGRPSGTTICRKGQNGWLRQTKGSTDLVQKFAKQKRQKEHYNLQKKAEGP